MNSDGKAATFVNYKKGTSGYLQGIHFAYNNKVNAYQLTVDQIHGGSSGSGPFPNAPIAKPAVYPGAHTPIILSVNGTQIINNKGRAIVLKGLVLS